MKSVTTVEMLKMLEIQERSLVDTLSGELTTEKRELVSNSLSATRSEFLKIVKSEFSKFKSFCKENKKLYTGFSVMFRDTDRIVDVSLNLKKDAVFVLLENTFDNCLKKSGALIPFEFINSPESFLEIREKYVKKYYLNLLEEEIKASEEQALEIEKTKAVLKERLNNFGFHYTQMMKAKSN